MADQSRLEFYKLAAGIIPVLWLGTVIQRLDPTPHAVEVQRLYEAQKLQFAESHRREAEEERPEPGSKKWQDRSDADVREFNAGISFLERRSQAVKVAPYALVAILLAVISEALALYGAAATDTGWAVTVGVAVGLLAGAALLLIPMMLRWLRIWLLTPGTGSGLS